MRLSDSELTTFPVGPLNGPWSRTISMTLQVCAATVVLGQIMYLLGAVRAVNVYAQDASKQKVKSP